MAKRFPKPLYANVFPVGDIGGLITIVDSKGDVYLKQLDFSISPIQTQYVAWTYIGNPWKQRKDEEENG